jgi:hypothetical protein
MPKSSKFCLLVLTLLRPPIVELLSPRDNGPLAGKYKYVCNRDYSVSRWRQIAVRKTRKQYEYNKVQPVKHLPIVLHRISLAKRERTVTK